MKKLFFIAILTLVAISQLRQAAAQSGTPVIVQETAAPQTPTQVAERVNELKRASGTFHENLTEMSTVSVDYRNAIVSSLELTNAAAIDQAIDEARYKWVMNMTRAAGKANARLDGVISSAADLGNWADGEVRQLKLTLAQRISEAKRLNKKVVLDPDEQLDLAKLGQVDLQHAIQLHETELSADRLQGLLEQFTDNIGRLKAVTQDLRQTKGYYSQFSTGLLKASVIVDEDRTTQQRGAALGEAVQGLEQTSENARTRLLNVIDDWRQKMKKP